MRLVAQPGAKRLAFLALTLAGACWGLGFPLGKLALRELEAPHVILLRFATAAFVAAPFALVRPEARALFRSPAVLISGALYGVAFLVQYEGLVRVNVTLAALLVGAMPALVAVSSRLAGERIARAAWIGVAAATAGAALIAGKPGAAGLPLGVALSLGALLIFLAWLRVSRRAPASSPMALSAATVIVATAVVLPIALALHGVPKLALSPAAWVGIVGQGVLSTLIATAAWQYGAARVGSASAGVFINIEPLMGAAIGVLLFGDRLTWTLVLGGLLILAGSFGVVLAEKAALPPTPTLA